MRERFSTERYRPRKFSEGAQKSDVLFAQQTREGRQSRHPDDMKNPKVAQKALFRDGETLEGGYTLALRKVSVL